MAIEIVDLPIKNGGFLVYMNPSAPRPPASVMAHPLGPRWNFTAALTKPRDQKAEVKCIWSQQIIIG